MNWILVVNTFAVLYYLSLHFVSGLVTATLMYSAHFLFVKGQPGTININKFSKYYFKI